jgi:hypothetical protein
MALLFVLLDIGWSVAFESTLNDCVIPARRFIGQELGEAGASATSLIATDSCVELSVILAGSYRPSFSSRYPLQARYWNLPKYTWKPLYCHLDLEDHSLFPCLLVAAAILLPLPTHAQATPAQRWVKQ